MGGNEMRGLETAPASALRDNRLSLAACIDARLLADPQRKVLTWLERGERTGLVLTAVSLRGQGADLARRILAAQPRLQPASQVLLVMPPGPEFLVALVACLYAGLVAVPLPMPRPGAPGDRLDAVIADASAQAVLTTAEAQAPVAALMPGIPLIVCTGAAAASDGAGFDGDTLESLPGMHLTPSSTVLVQYTSGSTRTPRGVAVSGGNVIANAQAVADEWQVRGSDTMLSWLPHYHDMGLMGSLLFPLLWGIPLVQMSPLAFVQKPVRWLKAVQAHGATLSGGPAFGFALCLETIPADMHPSFDLSGWRLAYCGAEPVPAALMQRFRDAFATSRFDGAALFSTYGLAEATLFVAGRRCDSGPPPARTASSAVSAPHPAPRPAAPAGTAALLTEPCHLGPASRARLCIVDPQTLRPVPDGQQGEIWATGPSVSPGYLTQGRDDVFGLTLPDTGTTPWMRTGDLGRIDAANGAVLHITGRRKDILIAHGVNVAAADVEWRAAEQDAALNAHAAAAIDLRQDGTGAIALLIEPRDGRQPLADPEALAKKIRASVRSSYGLSIELLCFVKRGSLDRTSSGKIRRQSVAAKIRDGYRYPPAPAD